MKTNLKIFLFLFIVLVSCSPKETKIGTDTTIKQDSSSNKDSVVFIKQPEIINAISFFTSAYLYELKGNPTIAYSGYLFAHKYDSTSIELMEALMRTSPSDSLKLNWAKKILNTDSTNLTTIRDLGDYYFSKNNRKEALKYYNKYISIDKSINENNNYIYYRLGTINYEFKNINKSIDNFNVLINQNERFAFVRKNLILLLSHDNKINEIDSLYNVWAQNKNSNKYIIYSEYGTFLESFGKERKALTMYKIALSFANNKNDTLNIYKNISNNAFKLKMFDKMISSTEKILEEDSTYILGMNRLAIYYYNIDSTKLSQNYLKKSLKIDSTQVLPLYFIGLIETINKNYSKAKYNFRNAIKYDPKYIPAYLNLGYLELLDGNYNTADTLLTFVLSQDSSTYNSQYFYGLTKLYKKEYKKAVYHLGKAVKLVKNKEAYDIEFDYGTALEQSNMIDSAITIFTKIVEKQPNYDPALNYLGYLLIDKNIDIEKGNKLIDRALIIDPNNGAYIDSKGWYLYKKGEYNKSLKYLLKAYKIVGDDLEILEHLGDVYTKLSNKKEATKYYEKILKLKKDK